MFIARNRAPRVRIEYDVELYGAEKTFELPFVIGVLADLSGRSDESLPPLADRKFLDIDIDNFDSRMSAIRPRVVLKISDPLRADGELSLDITFECLDDFAPAGVAKSVGAMRTLLTGRQQLATLVSYMDGKTGAEDLISKVLQDRALLELLRGTPAPGRSAAGPAIEAPDEVLEAPRHDFASSVVIDGESLFHMLEKEFRPKSDHARLALQQALITLGAEALAHEDLILVDASKSLQDIVAALDRKLSRLLNVIVHHADFQKLESAWRGLHYLVSNTETDEMLKIRFMNVTKVEFSKCLRRYEGTGWDQSPLFKRIYEDEYGQFGGEPFGCLVGDYLFDQTPSDVELLGGIAKICAAAHTPFVAGASLTLLDVVSCREKSVSPNIVGRLMTPDYAGWRELRQSDESRYIGLAMPRFLARAPFGDATIPVEDFAFEEETGNGDQARYTWCNAAYAMAVSITRAFKLYGWCARIRGIESGGAVEGLATHRFPTGTSGFDTVGPVELAINDRLEAELAKSGFMPMVHRKDSDFAAFIGACSLHEPSEYDDPEATANATLAARLPYLFACCRFAQYLKCLIRDRIGSFRERADMERCMQHWIQNYVDPYPGHSSEMAKAQRPLAAAQIMVAEVEGNPGYYTARLYLRPHYQLEGLTTSMRLVSRLPSAKASA